MLVASCPGTAGGTLRRGPLCNTNVLMYTRERAAQRIVHARLDAHSLRIRSRLRRQLGWNDSEIVRRGIQALEGLTREGPRLPLVGLGEFASGVPDLGSNPKHLEGFGST